MSPGRTLVVVVPAGCYLYRKNVALARLAGWLADHKPTERLGLAASPQWYPASLIARTHIASTKNVPAKFRLGQRIGTNFPLGGAQRSCETGQLATSSGGSNRRANSVALGRDVSSGCTLEGSHSLVKMCDDHSLTALFQEP